LKEKLPEYMVPSNFILLEKFPLTVNGKVDRKHLPAPHTVLKPDGRKGEMSELECRVAEIWAKILGIERNLIGRDSNFFDLGGHSLKATLMNASMQKMFHVQIPLTEIFKHPTVMEQAGYLEARPEIIYERIPVAEEKEYYPVSSAQKRMFILNKIKGQSTSDNTPSVLVAEGELGVEQFERAVNYLIERHETLRTSFEEVEGVPVQKIYPLSALDFKIEYGEGLEDEVEYMIESFIRPFDLSRPPLLRVSLIRMTPRRHLLMMDMHHIISDGMSVGVLIRDFVNLYGGGDLPALRIQYKDFSQWQNQRFDSERLKKQEDYWLNVFSGELPVLKMPYDYPRPQVQSYEGDYIDFSLTVEQSREIYQLVTGSGATLYMVMLAIFTILLSRYSDQEDIVIGTSIAGRLHADLENLIGFFINTLPMRNFPIGEKGFMEFLAEVKSNALEAYENQDYQFDELVSRLGIKRDLNRTPLFSAHFTMQNIVKPELTVEYLGDLAFKPYEFNEKTTQFDIIIHGFESDDTISFKLRYCTKLFKRETIEAFVAYFKEIVAIIVNNKDIKLMDITLSDNFSESTSSILMEGEEEFGF
jgi:acyl carrier protein